MCESIDHLASALGSALSSLDPRRLAAQESTHLVETFARIERLAVAGRTLAAGRAAETRAWRASGHRTAAEWMASRTQSGVSEAITTLQTAHSLSTLPATREALVSGRLSAAQAAEITSAASADPSAEASLLRVAEQGSLPELKERCRAARAAAASDEDATERIRRGRYLRHWTDRDGALRLDGRLTPDDGARVVAAVMARADRIATEARRSGQREPLEAYAADALVSLADGPPGPKALVQVRVDETALARGRTRPGEECGIPGVGPISVTAARRLAGDGIVAAVVTEGADVTRVAHLGRTIAARVRTALEARDPTCVVPGCSVRRGLEIDHVIPFVGGGPTRLDNLARLCRWHHAQKTHHGWRLGGRPGAWTWTRPGRQQALGPPVAHGPPMAPA